MSIRLKTILVIILTFLILAGALILSARSVLLASFSELEDQDARQKVMQVASAVSEVLAKMNSTARDWSSWDDTYNFVKNHNQAFIDKNLDITTFVNLNLNCMLFIDTAQRLVCSKYLDLLTPAEVELPTDFFKSFSTSYDYAFPNIPDTGLTGLVMLPQGPLLVTARKILKSDDSGPAVGVLVLGKFLDSMLIARLHAVTHLNFCADPFDSSSLHPDLKTIIPLLSKGQELIILPKNTETIMGYAQVKDLRGNPAEILRVTIPREIYQHGQRAISYAIIWLLAITLIFGLLVVLIVEKSILSQLTSLGKQIDQLKKGADLTQRLPVERTDEWGKLSGEINSYISALQESQQQLNRSEHQYGVLFKEMLNAFALHEIICDDSGNPCNYRYLEVNPAYEHMTCFSRTELIGRTVLDVMPEVDPALIKKYGVVALTGESVYFEHNCKALKRYFEIAAFSPAQNQFAVTMTDISERKRVEVENQKMQAQLLQSQKMEAVGTLAGGIAHDFNNLLCAIQGYTEILLKEKSVSELSKRALTVINNASQKGTELVKQILTFSRKAETRQKPINLNHEIEQITGMLARVIPKMIVIETHYEELLNTVNADPAQIEQLLMNLALNARDAMPEGGKLIIETHNVDITADMQKNHPDLKPGPHVLISISDTGHGIPKDVLPHIFEPFFTTKEIGKGTGLGLSTVYGIVKTHNGSISCYSEPGAGTIFKMYLPAIDAAVTQSRSEAATATLPQGSETILLIDDEDMVRSFCEEMLTGHGYSVLMAPNGETGVELYKKDMKHIHAIILDLIMPGMGGKRCLDELLRINPDVKVIVASGYSASVQMQDILAQGAKGFVSKPYSLSQILTTLRNVLDKK